jgi:aryl-alcohol dehydrogenase-like predicted oxidoreductase
LKGRDLTGPNEGLARDMVSFVLENDLVDTCICGVISEAELIEDLSASRTRLTPEARQRLESLAADSPCRGYHWLEESWQFV